MKNKLVLIISVLVVLVILFSSFNEHQKQEQKENRYLTMRVIEGGAVAVPWDNKIITAYDDGKMEEIPLDKTRPGNFSTNLKKVNDQINSLSGKGYELVGMSGTDQLITTYVFKKAN